MLFWSVMTALYLIGCAASNAFQRRIGWADEGTYGDCLTGDYTLDMFCVLLWPLFWPLWFAHKAGDYVARKAGY